MTTSTMSATCAYIIEDIIGDQHAKRFDAHILYCYKGEAYEYKEETDGDALLHDIFAAGGPWEHATSGTFLVYTSDIHRYLRRIGYTEADIEGYQSKYDSNFDGANGLYFDNVADALKRFAIRNFDRLSRQERNALPRMLFGREVA